MPTIKVDTDSINSYAAEMKEVLRRVRSIEAEYAAAYSNLDWEIRAASNIEHRLTSIHNDLLSQIRGIEEFIQFFELAAREYDAVEKANKALDYSEGAGAAVATGAAAATSARFTTGSATETGEVFTTGSSINVGNAIPVSTNKDDKNSNIYSSDAAQVISTALGECGIMGAVFSSVFGVRSAIASGDSTKFYQSLFNIGKNYSKAFGELAGEGTLKSKFWGDFSKANAKQVGKQACKASFENEFAKYSFKNAKNVWQKLQVGAKWAGVAFSFGSNYLGNVDEYKGTGNTSRIVAETITETAIDFALDGAATAIAATALGAAAPAAIAGAVAVWGLNKTTESITSWVWGEENKKNFTELASDVILDSVESVGGAISAGWKKMFG